MDLNLQGLRVLVTAGASGIGLATARAFAREGAHVHVCDIDEAALASLATSDPGISRSTCDVADATSVARLFHETQLALGDRKSTRLNSSHEWISYAVFCLKKKKTSKKYKRKHYIKY